MQAAALWCCQLKGSSDFTRYLGVDAIKRKEVRLLLKHSKLINKRVETIMESVADGVREFSLIV